MAFCKVFLVRDQTVIADEMIGGEDPLAILRHFKRGHLTYIGDRIQILHLPSGKAKEYEVTKNWWEGETQPRFSQLQ